MPLLWDSDNIVEHDMMQNNDNVAVEHDNVVVLVTVLLQNVTYCRVWQWNIMDACYKIDVLL